jgi:UDP-glucose 4-epimerase
VAAEELLSDAAATGLVTGVVIRTFNLAGASRGMPDTDTTRVIPAALAVATGGRDAFAVNGAGDVVREYTHVSDVARAYVAAIDRPMTGPFSVYNVWQRTRLQRPRRPRRRPCCDRPRHSD